MTEDSNAPDREREPLVEYEHDGVNTAPLVPYVVEHHWRRLKLPMIQSGKPVEKYLAPIVVEWLDRGTGEILSDANALRDSRYQHLLRVSERCRQREYVLSKLRPEVRAFALFVLQFRNRRRGVTPGIQALAKWYAQYANKRPDNVRRYIRRLQDARILESDSLVGKLWQINDTSAVHAQEAALASLRFAAMRLGSQASI
ncbi:hypothetical protein [Paraburkholderia sp. RL17-373-BIF-A]|uniref:hypothetical protein n=1 Tax=Paraburkholderia sp. RL17-373-BIF-A TaxID=3031629 RepID=UPI0038B9DA2B